MDRIIKLALLAAVVYFAITALLPRLRDISSTGGRELGDVGSGAGHCVMTAEMASRDFGDGVRQFSRRPIDVEAWDRVESELSSSLFGAEDACSCPEEACDVARRALDELRSILDQFDAGFRGEEPVPFNAAGDLQRAQSLLDEARGLAR